MVRLSLPLVDIKAHYEIVVIGSGYGGSIAASRLARAGRQVCVLERGKEYIPGEFPDTELEAVAETQVNSPWAHRGSRLGLYHYHVNDDMVVLVGCGLGGTSLINANVALRPDPRVFNNPRWPQAFRDDVDTLLEDGYQRAKEMLQSTPYPDHFPALSKTEALQKAATALDADCYRPPLNITFQDGPNRVGVEQQACKLCGDCVSGCNHAAKNTTAMNYLPDARHHGAEIYTQVAVRTIERQNGRWLVHYQTVGTGSEKFDAPTASVSADIVILAAGTLGSTEILLRSKAAGLPLSDQLGHNFSGNGDVGGMAYNCDQEVNAVGVGQRPERTEPVGPTITAVIDMRDGPDPEEGVVVEEGTIHSWAAKFVPQTLAAAAKVSGKDTDSGIADLVAEKSRELESLVRGAYHGAVKNTLIYLVMAHDDSNGRMKLINDRIRINWSGIGQQPFVEKINKDLEKGTRALGGTFLKNPLWSLRPEHTMVTAHPLGGCPMAEDASEGVVNHKGQVFASSSGTAVYKGLYVCDGAVIPHAIGSNLLLAVSAIAERTVALLAQDRGWTINYALSAQPAPPPATAPQKLGVQFSETMHGYFSTKVKDDYEAAARQGQEDGCRFKFVLTIEGESLEQMMANPGYEAHVTGVVTAPLLSAEPLTVTEGRFNLFVTEPDDPEGQRRMRYRMRMTSEDGDVYFLKGFKLVRDDPRFDLWQDTTTLYMTIYEGDSDASPVLGIGILQLTSEDFRRQVTTLRIKNAASLGERVAAIGRFGRFFGGALFDIYGETFARPTLFNPDAPPRKKRPLRITTPEAHYFQTADELMLRLTRYRGGDKGPVMLVHGMGVSSLAFSIDTVETNLLEYLFAHGYDVWLLDYRASIELPYAPMVQTGDDIARYDWPAAVATVRRITGASTIQVVAHCYGAITFCMAMLNGLQGVRSAVCSQVGAHLNVAATTRIKSGLYIASVMETLGIESLTMYTDSHDNWLDRLYNKMLRFYPTAEEEQCNNPVCRRVNFLYAPLYEHDQLNNATHDVVHELFGVAAIGNFEHVSTLVRKGQLITATGEDAYMPHVERLAIPIAFVQGAENETWTPRSTERTYKWLRKHNGKGLYSRHLVPNYGHLDCIFGRHAARDVYPLMLQHLEKTAAPF